MRSVKVKPTNVEEEEGKKSKKDSGSSASCSQYSYTDVSITKKDKEDVEKRYKDTAKVVYMELAEEISKIMKTTCHDSLAQGYLLLGTKKTILYCANGNTPIYISSKPKKSESTPMILTQEDSYSILISPKHSPSEKRINESFSNEHETLSGPKLSGNATSIAPDETLLKKVDKSNRPRRKLCRIS